MGNVLEHHGKGLLARVGIPVPRHAVADTPEEAAARAREIGLPVVIKALVPVGGRGKAGAVRIADTVIEVEQQARALLEGPPVRGFPVEQILVEEKLDIAAEWYLAAAVDHRLMSPVIMAGTHGGMDVEESVRAAPGSMAIESLRPGEVLRPFEAQRLWNGRGAEGAVLGSIAHMTVLLNRALYDYDATLIEINPVAVLEDNRAVAAAVVMKIDDAALFRQPLLADVVQVGSDRAWRPLTELESQAVALNQTDPYRGTARYTEMPGGDIGFLCGGGGGSLLFYDALQAAGGRPANYTEFGGNPTEHKVRGLTRIVLSKPGVRGLFVAQNITNNTQVDVVARGVVAALRDLNLDATRFPVVVREAGLNDEAGARIFREAGVEWHGEDLTMTEAARLMVARMRQVYPGYPDI